MRNLKRNEKQIYYANLTDTITDGWGNNGKEYGSPQPFRLSVSVERGTSEPDGYGNSLNYTREMVTHDMTCPINEYSRLWIDRATSEPYNYKVKRVSRSLNCIVYALERVEVS